MTNLIDSEAVSRTVLALIDGGEFDDLGDAESYLASFQPTVFLGGASCSSYAAQAAALSVVSCAVRAFRGAHVQMEADTHSLWRGAPPTQFVELARQMGADTDVPARGKVAILIGDTRLDRVLDFEHVLRVTWEGWRAEVRAGPESSRLAEDDTVVISALAGAAMAVSEVFELSKRRDMACDRTMSLDLWGLELRKRREEGRRIVDVPSAWWLVGLGHLGQASGWVLSWLPSPRNHKSVVTLQDDQELVEANLSTSLCASPADLGRMKTRVVAEVLENAGYVTRIIERRLETTFSVTAGEVAVALFGVDNVEARLHSDRHGWPLVVDVGLGSGSTDFGAISMHVFPSETPSAEVRAWATNPLDEERRRELRLAKPGFQSLLKRHDVCGVETLAGTNVAASFVGLMAACLSISEVLRTLQDGPTFSSVALELWDVDPRVDSGRAVPRNLNSFRT